MRKSLSLVCMLFLVLTMLSGCWSSKELNELSIASALGVDKTKDGFQVTVQIVNPSEIAGKTQSNRVEVVTFTTNGKTIFEALRKLTNKSPRRIYLSHIRTIIFGEKIAKAGIKKTLDFISRNYEMRTDFIVVVGRDTTAKRLLEIQTSIEKIPANKIYNTLESAEKNSSSVKVVELDELINNITTIGIEPVLTGVQIMGESKIGDDNPNVETVDPKSRIKIDSIAAFKGDRLKGWLSMKESIGYNYLNDNIKFAIVVLKEKDCDVTVETVKSKTKISSMSRRGKPIIIVNVKSEGNIGEVQCKLDITSNDTMKKLEKNYEEKQKKVIMSVIKKAQTEFKSDIFGFGEEVYRSNPALWKKIKGNWDEEFSNLEVKVNVKSKIRDAGTITKSF